ncbi:MAG: peptide chain release factor N(5)-glutamine methyltransferase [Firmicutes bacterium]|nr:peptide chain release factor N(5)-glutamine methyltransferase [Bacillota bacterium]
MSLPLKELIRIGETQLRDAGIMDSVRDAKDLYCFLDKLDAVGLMMHWQDVLADNVCEAYFELIERRAGGEPMQYITGVQEFMGLTFNVNPSVLIPRQDTETMVEDALEVLSKGTLRGEAFVEKPNFKDVLDLCTGSGAIGVSIAKLNGNVKVTCSDLSEKALETAKGNAIANGMKSVKFEQGDLFAPFCGKLGKKKFDFIISNPPYIESEVIPTLQTEVKDHEPMMALDGGIDGLDFYKRIAEESPNHLKKGGVLMMEIGYNQGEAVCQLLEATDRFEKVACLQDLAHKDRIVVGLLKNKK